MHHGGRTALVGVAGTQRIKKRIERKSCSITPLHTLPWPGRSQDLKPMEHPRDAQDQLVRQRNPPPPDWHFRNISRRYITRGGTFHNVICNVWLLPYVVVVIWARSGRDRYWHFEHPYISHMSVYMFQVHSQRFCFGHVQKEGNVLFNDALNTFYLRLYGE